jgi:membrane protease YdiL (CAAX protease family)
MSASNVQNNNGSIRRVTRVFKNRFGHFRAAWRILFYLVFAVVLLKLLDLLGDSFLLTRGENLSDYSLLLNRLASKSIRLLSVFIPGIVLLKWVDKRPITLLGTGRYKGFLRELSIGMLMGLIAGTAGVLILRLTGWASFTFNGFSMDMLLYLLGCLAVLVVSASYEEILFRGYVFQSLIEGSNFWITLVVFSLLFGAGHIGNVGVTVFTIAFTVIAGVFLGVIYFKTRALWICIGVHFMWNWTMAPIFGMGVSDSKFLRRSLFSYKPWESGFIGGPDTLSEIVQGIVLLALTIYIWKASWLKPAEYNRRLWAKYPPKYGTEPEPIEQSVFTQPEKRVP